MRKRFYSLKKAVQAVFGETLQVVGYKPVYGGDINQAYQMTLSDGSVFFMKCNGIRNYDFFRAEEEGLEALRAPGVIGVPRPLAVGTDESQGISFLLMEFLQPAKKIRNYWEVFGRELALLHRAGTSGLVSENGALCFGFQSDNYLGASRQMNTPKACWTEFFRDCRLRPQMRMAEKKLDIETERKCEVLLDRLDTILAEPEFPSLLHGDLWSGNAFCGPDGKAWIFDPAVYVGNFEAELATTELFSRYPDTFYQAYNEVNRIDRGYEERKNLYNLYHMLNHFNLFGGAYLRSVRQILNHYV
ncbi:MAG: fructosamine kinase family protein [Clostridiales bacterium]|nr:fructosamine kinase family protein [Clostridiales bacterium]